MNTKRKKKLTLAQRLAFRGPMKTVSSAYKIAPIDRMGIRIGGGK